MKRALLVLPVVWAVIFCGCESLPEGDPPAGVLVENTLREVYSEADAADYLATRFSLFMLENYPGAAVVCDADAATLHGALYALRESSYLSGTHQEMEAEISLRTRAAEDAWVISVRRSGFPLWEEVLVVKGDPKELPHE